MIPDTQIHSFEKSFEIHLKIQMKTACRMSPEIILFIWKFM